MSGNLFIPKMQRVVEEVPEEVESRNSETLVKVPMRITQYVVVALFGLLPLFFTPGIFATLGFDKVIFTLVCGVVVLVLLCLMSLRSPKVDTILPLTLGLFWMVAFAAFASGVISGDTQDALRGSFFETQTAGFITIMALAMSIPLVLQGSKPATIKALALFGISASLLLIYAILRLLLGTDFLSLGSFNNATLTPIGTFNDLAIFAGLIIILGLVTLIQLPLRAVMQWWIISLIVLSLFVSMVINFLNIWIVIGIFAFLVLMYLLSRDRLFKGSKNTSTGNTTQMIAVAALVSILSAIFIFAGDFASQKMTQLTNIDYVEVRPSIEATSGIANAVYQKNALFGIGANRFVDAWQLHKDPSINNTIFWDTDFSAGSGFVPTIFVNLGLLGGILLIAFHIGLLYLGYRMLLRPERNDPYWYYFGVVSFTAASFIWGMSYVYVPGPTILLLGAIFSGFTLVAAAALLPRLVRVIPLSTNRQRGFLSMAVTVVVVTVSVASLSTVGKQYFAQAQFNEARGTAVTPEVFTQVIADAYALYPDERFLRALAQMQIGTLNSLLSVSSPNEEQQQTFLKAAEVALVAIEQAVQKDPTDPDNHTVLAGVFNNLALVGIEGSQQRADTALAEAQSLDPQNPGYSLVAAQIAARKNDVETARREVGKALELKRNFTPAMYLSAQLDISEGKTEAAIETTRSIIMLEPRNPTRYFQLGVLLSATDQLPEAMAAYRAAISLDPQYANARYLLALAHLKGNETQPALDQLRKVQETNPENQQLAELIKQVESGEYQIPATQQFETPVGEQLGEESNSTTINTDDVASDLVTPVNAVTEGEASVSPSVPETFPASSEEAGTTSPVVESEVVPGQ
ncbi:MAG: tetratricopeptide repeat protein [Candidatus Pacebacteria bacterium]|nr:tetratricopeptide repeat protein [Candidatus Paceibacterota bacterium]